MTSRAVCTVQICGALDALRLRDALGSVVRQHESLRTVFSRQAGMRFPFQVVLDTDEPGWEQLDLRQVSEAEQCSRIEAQLTLEMRRKPDLDRGPLLHATLITLQPERSVLLLGVPTLCADAQSLPIIVRDTLRWYTRQAASMDEPLRYVQFAQWQNELLESDDVHALEGRAYWHEILSTRTKPVTLPFERAGVPGTLSMARTRVRLTERLAQPLAALAAASGTTVGDVLLVCWHILLARLTGQFEIATGVVVDGRGYSELEQAVGAFAKSVPVATRLDATLTVRELLQQVHGTLQGATEWQEHFDPTALDGPFHFSYRELGTEERCGDLSWRLQSVHAPIERGTLCSRQLKSPQRSSVPSSR